MSSLALRVIVIGDRVQYNPSAGFAPSRNLAAD